MSVTSDVFQPAKLLSKQAAFSKTQLRFLAFSAQLLTTSESVSHISLETLLGLLESLSPRHTDSD
jgi:predicted YcjX-like family ATPase